MNMSHKDKKFLNSVAIRKLLEYKPLLIIVIFALILCYIHAYNSRSFMYGLMGYFFLFLAIYLINIINSDNINIITIDNVILYDILII